MDRTRSAPLGLLLLVPLLLPGAPALADGTKGLTRASRVGESASAVPVSPVSAVVVGISRFAHLPPDAALPSGETDAALFADALARAFPSPPVRLLGDSATADAVRRELHHVLAAAGPDETVLLSFDTHGVRVGRDGFLLVADTLPGDDLARTSVSLAFLRDEVAASRARQVVVFADVVHQAISVGPGVGSGPAGSPAPLLGALVARDGVFVQAMQGPAAWQSHGAYTIALLDALSGRGDLDRDGVVNLDEVAVALAAALPRVDATVSPPATYGTFHAPLGVPVGAVPPPPTPLPPSAWAAPPPTVTVCLARDGAPVPGDTVFHTGDELGLSLRVPSAGYLYAVGIGPTGEEDVLFPWGNEDPRVARGATQQIPPSTELPIFFTDPVGPEPVYLVYSAAPLPTADKVVALAKSRASGKGSAADWVAVTGTKGLSRLQRVASASPCAEYTPQGDEGAWVLEMVLKHG